MIANQLPGLVELREVYEQTHSAAAVVKAIAGSGSGFFLDWAKQMRAVFCLSLSEVKPIGGWEPDGTGELDDTRLDALLVPDIENRRNQWGIR